MKRSKPIVKHSTWDKLTPASTEHEVLDVVETPEEVMWKALRLAGGTLPPDIETSIESYTESYFNLYRIAVEGRIRQQVDAVPRSKESARRERLREVAQGYFLHHLTPEELVEQYGSGVFRMFAAEAKLPAEVTR